MLETENTETSLLFHCKDRIDAAIQSFDNHLLWWANQGLQASRQRREELAQRFKDTPRRVYPKRTAAEEKELREFWQRVAATKTYKQRRELRQLRNRVKLLEAQNQELRLRDKAARHGCLGLYEEINELIKELRQSSFALTQVSEEKDFVVAREQSAKIRAKLNLLLPRLPA